MNNLVFTFPSASGTTVKIPVVEIEKRLFVPTSFMMEAKGWLTFITPLFPLSTDNWIVSSVESTLTGVKRGGTHLDPGAIDIAPFLTLDSPFRSDKRSPRLYNNRMFAAELVKRHAKIKSELAIVLEDDHLHIDFALAPGVYLYPYSRYPGDHFVKTTDWIQEHQRSLMKVDRNGNAYEVNRESVVASPSHVKKMKERILGTPAMK